jgi:hypothetical protein
VAMSYLAATFYAEPVLSAGLGYGVFAATCPSSVFTRDVVLGAIPTWLGTIACQS